MDLAAILPRPALQMLQGAFSRATGLAIVLTDPEGGLITQWSGLPRACSACHWQTPETRERCTSVLRELGARAAESGRCGFEPCPIGQMLVAAVPVVVAGRHVASLHCGHALAQPSDDPQRAEGALALGVDPPACRGRLSQDPVVSVEELEATLDNMRALAGAIALMAEDAGRRTPAERTAEDGLLQYRDLFDNSPDLLFGMDREGRLAAANRSLRAMIGDDGGFSVGAKFEDLLHPDDKLAARDALERLQRGEVEAVGLEVRCRRADGSRALLLVRTASIPESDGRPLAFTAVARDITAEREREDAVIALIRNLRAANDIARAVGATLDADSLLRVVLEEMRSLVSADAVTIVVVDDDPHRATIAATSGRPLPEQADLVVEPGSELASVLLERRALLVSHEEVTDKQLARVLGSTGVGSAVLYPIVGQDRCLGMLSLWSARPGHFGHGQLDLLDTLAPHIAGAFANARSYRQLLQAHHELEAAQGRLVAAERARAVAEVSAGVAHDLNNMLGGILGRTQLMLLRGLDGETRVEVERIQRAVLEGADTVRRIQRFVRRRELSHSFTSVDLADVVKHAVEMTRHRWSDMANAEGRSIRVTTDVQDGLRVFGSASELHEVVANLILNACDALPVGGHITIAAAEDGADARLTVTDDGTGMDAETAARVFEPLFTTKGEDGTGLGLAVSHSIVQRHGGTISVETQLGRGSTFTVLLPRMTELPPSDELAGSESKHGKCLAVLAVDDDSSTLDYLEAALSGMGHSVTAANSGRSAVNRLWAGERYDVIITDLGMPDVTGRQVAEAAKSAGCDTVVILVTGWGPDAGVGIEPVDITLTKPLALGDLRQALERAEAILEARGQP